jgi:hypothetical protein
VVIYFPSPSPLKLTQQVSAPSGAFPIVAYLFPSLTLRRSIRVALYISIDGSGVTRPELFNACRESCGVICVRVCCLYLETSDAGIKFQFRDTWEGEVVEKFLCFKF